MGFFCDSKIRPQPQVFAKLKTLLPLLTACVKMVIRWGHVWEFALLCTNAATKRLYTMYNMIDGVNRDFRESFRKALDWGIQKCLFFFAHLKSIHSHMIHFLINWRKKWISIQIMTLHFRSSIKETTFWLYYNKKILYYRFFFFYKPFFRWLN